MAGAIISQTLSAGLLSLGNTGSASGASSAGEGDGEGEGEGSVDLALCGLLVAALVQLGVVAKWWHAIRGREGERPQGEEGTDREDGGGARADEAEMGLLMGDEAGVTVRGSADDGRMGAGEREGEELLGRKERLEMRRGTRALRAAAATVVASWACFVWNVVHG